MSFIFGYLKPYRNELKLKHINEYKKAYCTVCYGLRKNLGLLSTIFLNYESVFLYVFFEGFYNIDELKHINFRCPTNPLKKVKSKVNYQLLEYVSFINYELVLLKVIDNYRDSKNIIYKLADFTFSKNKRYLELQQKYRYLDTKIRYLYDELYRLEINDSPEFDKCSATMGNLLYEIVKYHFKVKNIECEKAEELAKHLGMWVYLIDAYDDYEKDIKKHIFNPLYTFERKNNNCANNINHNLNTSVLMFAEIMLKMMIENMNELIQGINFTKNAQIINNIIKYTTINEIKKIKQNRVEYKNEKRKTLS